MVILRGAGERAFVAGADISQFKDRRRNMADEEEYRRISGRGAAAPSGLKKPLLAMIHGYCIGGGVGIAIGCDIRIAADDARFGIPAARLGLGYHYNGMDKLIKLVGPSYTKEIFFTARTDWTAQDALRMGLINQVVPKADLEQFTRDYALTIARNAPLTLLSAKSTVEQLARPEAERDLALGNVTWGWLDSALRAVEWLRGGEAVAKVSIPVTVVAAGDDRLVDNGAQAAVVARLPHGRYVEIPGALHEIMMETDELRAPFWREFDALAASISRPA